MKTASTSLTAHLGLETATLATCWKITRPDGQVFTFTDHDVTIPISGYDYEAALGYSASAVETSQGLAGDNLEIKGIMESPSITEADLIAGKWDHAEVEIFMVNWANPAMGVAKLRKGWLSETKNGLHRFESELHGLFKPLQQTLMEQSTPICRANLFDSRCKVNSADYVSSGTVSSGDSTSIFTYNPTTTTSTWYDAGKVLWRTGANSGLSMEVKTQTQSGTVFLNEQMPYTIVPGDAFSIWAGCLKRSVEDCTSKFNNIINIRAEPHRPGYDQIAIGPG